MLRSSGLDDIFQERAWLSLSLGYALLSEISVETFCEDVSQRKCELLLHVLHFLRTWPGTFSQGINQRLEPTNLEAHVHLIYITLERKLENEATSAGLMMWKRHP